MDNSRPTSSVFVHGRRGDARICGPTESTYAFLNRVDDEGFGRVRELIDSWYSRYVHIQGPEEAKHLRTRLQAGDDGAFHAAFWELYLHEAHVRLGYSVLAHPQCARSSKPDFRISNGAYTFFLEAATVGQPENERRAHRRQAELIGVIDQAFHPDFALMLRTVVPPTTMPTKREVVGKLNAWMAKHEWGELRRRVEVEGAEAEKPTIDLPVRDGLIEAILWPREPARRGDPTFPTAMTHPPRSGFGPKEAVRAKLANKGTTYGDLGAPFVVALYDLSPFGDDYEIEAALYGHETVVLTLADSAVVNSRPGRAAEGGLYRPEPDEFALVSGVMSAAMFSYASVARVLPTYWPNPWPARPLLLREPWHVRRADLGANELRNDSSSVLAHELFGLSKEWPGQFFTQRRRLRHGVQAA